MKRISDRKKQGDEKERSLGKFGIGKFAEKFQNRLDFVKTSGKKKKRRGREISGQGTWWSENIEPNVNLYFREAPLKGRSGKRDWGTGNVGAVKNRLGGNLGAGKGGEKGVVGREKTMFLGGGVGFTFES